MIIEKTCPTDAGWITHVPIPLFAVTMGIGGLGMAWRRAHHTLGLPAWIGEALFVLAALCFVGIGLLYLVKLARCWGAVKQEFSHPVKINFFPAVSISLCILAGAALPYSRLAAEALWMLGTGLHLVFALVIVVRWFTHNFEIHHSNPSWFVPIVGNMIVAVAGVPLGYIETSWFFYSVGLLFWVILFAIIVYRIVFHDQLPQRFIPTLFIMLAPPALGFLDYVSMNGGVLDAFARVMFYNGMFIVLMLVLMARLFLRLDFTVSWWAYTFPSAAITAASLVYYEMVPNAFTLAVGYVLLAAATAIIATVTLKTVTALLGGRLFVAD